MSSTIPVTVPSPTIKTNGVDIIDADHINNVQDDIVALSNYIGMTGTTQAKNVTIVNLWRNLFNPLPTITWIDADTIEIAASVVSMFSGDNLVVKRNTSALQIKLSVNLDTGAEAANTWYCVYLCGDGTSTTYTAIFSASANAPTGYTYYKLIGAVKNDGSSNILKFYQDGDWVTYDLGQQALTNGTAQTWTDVDLATFVPPITELSLLTIAAASSAAANYSHVAVRPNGSAAIAITIAGGSNSQYFNTLPVRSSSRIIEYKIVIAGSTPTANIWVSGYYIGGLR